MRRYLGHAISLIVNLTKGKKKKIVFGICIIMLIFLFENKTISIASN